MRSNLPPLWMPPGSVRAVIALSVTAAFIAGAVEREVWTIVAGWYFITRTKKGDGA